MHANTVNDARIYHGASVRRLDERGWPAMLIKSFHDTPSAVAFLEDLRAAGTTAEFAVYENYSHPRN